MKNDIFVSLITVIEKNQDYKSRLKTLSDNLSQNYSYHEIIILENLNLSENLIDYDCILKTIPNIRYIKLSGTDSYDDLIFWGIENSIGDFIVTFDLNNDPIEEINTFVEESLKGKDIIIGDAVNYPQSRLYLFLSVKIRNFINNINKLKLSSIGTNLRCISRRALNSIRKDENKEESFHVMLNRTGFNIAKIRYSLYSISNIKKKTLKSELKRGLSEIVYSYGFVRLINKFAYILILLTLIINFIDAFNFLDISYRAIITINIIIILIILAIGIFLLNTNLKKTYLSKSNVVSFVFEKNSSVMYKETLNIYNDSEIVTDNKVQTGRNK